jgi:hypothetical protein
MFEAKPRAGFHSKSGARYLEHFLFLLQSSVPHLGAHWAPLFSAEWVGYQ